MIRRSQAVLSRDAHEELVAISEITDALGKPTHLFGGLYNTDPAVRELIDKNLITWGPSRRGSGWGNKFKQVSLTFAGRTVLKHGDS